MNLSAPFPFMSFNGSMTPKTSSVYSVTRNHGSLKQRSWLPSVASW